MPSVIISAPTVLSWRDAAALQLLIGIPWRDGALITSLGADFTPPAPPAGGTPAAPNTDPGFIFDIASTANIAHVVIVADLRDNAVLQITDLSIGTDADSLFWTLQCRAPGELFDRLTTGDEQAALSVKIDGFEWDFLVEDVQRSRTFNDSALTLNCRSQTVIAGAPYQYAQNWINDGPTTAAQIADQAQIYTEVEIDWRLEDWLVPDGVWSLTGTPLEVIKNVADAAGAIVQSDPVRNRVSVMPRYSTLPNEWPYLAPDIEIRLSAILVDGYQRADQPSHNAVYVSGQQSGVVCWVRLAWTTGARLAPMVTDPLITEEVAGAQRGVAILGGMGPQAKVTITLPFLPAYGPVPLSSIARVVDGALIWYGMVRAVSIGASLPSVTQQITIERHLTDVDGDEAVVMLPPPPVAPAGFAGKLGWYPQIVTLDDPLPTLSPDPTNRSNYTIGRTEIANVGTVATGYTGKAYFILATVVPDDSSFVVNSSDVVWMFSWVPGNITYPGTNVTNVGSSVSRGSFFGYIQGSFYIEVGFGDKLDGCFIGTATLTATVAGLSARGSLTVTITQEAAVLPGMAIPPIHVVLSGA